MCSSDLFLLPTVLDYNNEVINYFTLSVAQKNAAALQYVTEASPGSKIRTRRMILM